SPIQPQLHFLLTHKGLLPYRAGPSPYSAHLIGSMPGHGSGSIWPTLPVIRDRPIARQLSYRIQRPLAIDLARDKCRPSQARTSPSGLAFQAARIFDETAP